MLYHPVYSGLGLNLFAEKYFEHCQYGWGCLHCTQNIFQQINASQDLNTQGDREFRALSEYIITFLKIYVLYWRYNSTDPNVQNLFTKGIYIYYKFNLGLITNNQCHNTTVSILVEQGMFHGKSNHFYDIFFVLKDNRVVSFHQMDQLSFLFWWGWKRIRILFLYCCYQNRTQYLT